MALKNRKHRRHRERIAHYRLLDRENPLEVMPANYIYHRFRFQPVLFIVSSLQLYSLQLCFFFNVKHSDPVLSTPVLQVLLTLRFIATADTFSNISPSSVRRAAKYVCQCLCHISRRFIKMPTGNHADDAKVVCDRIYFNFSKGRQYCDPLNQLSCTIISRIHA